MYLLAKIVNHHRALPINLNVRVSNRSHLSRKWLCIHPVLDALRTSSVYVRHVFKMSTEITHIDDTTRHTS